jgi:tRNA A37 threonylcarbamoyladenosine modification protein TsaB
MYKIKIDSTERKNKSVELHGSEKLVAKKTGDIDIVSSIRELLEENKLNIEDIGLFEPSLGPGSYTGLRVGVTVSNVLNWALGRKTLKELDLPEYGAEPNIAPPKEFKL